jgi:tetratricopeptide (TPR) repeat protein
LNNLGILLDVGQRRQEAEAAYRRMIGILEELVQDQPALADYLDELGRGLNNLAGVQLSAGQVAAAEASYRRSIALRQKLVQQHPQVTEFVIGLGGSYGNLGNLTRKRGDAAAALRWYQLAAEQLEPVLARAPNNAKARRFLRNVCIERAVTLACVGEHARAVEQVNKLVEENTGDGPLLYNAACVHALAAKDTSDTTLKEQWASRAVELLSQARMAGFFKERRALEGMKNDDDLAALRQREDFKKLLRELDARE